MNSLGAKDSPAHSPTLSSAPYQGMSPLHPPKEKVKEQLQVSEQENTLCFS